MAGTGVVNIDVGGVVSGLMEGFDDLFTSDEERLAFEHKLRELLHTELMGQVAINQTEAEHASIFVAGWRPFLGWVCGLGFAMQVLVRPTIMYVNQLVSLILGTSDIPVPPALDMQQLMPLTLGMLGLAGYRTYEKTQKIPDSLVRFLTKK